MVLMLPVVSFAAQYRAGDQPSLQVSERIADDLYMAGGSVSSAGVVAGDLIVAGGSIVVSGDVGADVIAGGGTVTVLSNVGDDVRVGGGTVLVQGRVSGDVIVGGGQVTVGGPGVGGDVIVGGGTVRIDAPVAGNLKIAGGVVYINAPIAGDISIEADKVTLGSAAVVAGNLTYKAKAELVKEDGAVITGKVTFEPRVRQHASAALVAGLISLWVVGKFLMLLTCALVVGLIFRRYSTEAVEKATERPMLELGRGFLVIMGLPVVSMLLMVTVVGIPLGILGWIGFIALSLFAWIMAPILVGSIAHSYFSKSDMEVSWKTILLGVFLFELVGLVPLLGSVAQMLTMLIALGVITAIKLQIVRQWR